jgi:hypothetical protein
MAYIGQSPSIGNFQVCDAISTVNGQATYNLTVSSVAVTPETANHVLCSVNGVLQKPGSSFTIVNSTIVFSANLVTNDVVDFVHILGSVLDLGVPSDSTVSLAKLTATGTKDATTFLRGDNTFAAAGGGMFELITTNTISSAVAQVDFTSTHITTTYRDYRIVATGIIGSADDVKSQFLFSTDGGSSFLTDSHYDFAFSNINSDDNNQQFETEVNQAAINISGASTQGNATGEAGSFIADIFDPLNQTSDNSFIHGIGRGCYYDTGGVLIHYAGSFGRPQANTEDDVYNGIRVKYSSGNIAQGIISLYGRKV